ncbi:hypothetical protein O181_127769 [Austropuccinia psidii MF-1]|uniref:Retrotransposon gag domain-containing protein n=1 Tax=Austropuccinia psidii MF-1 TaxID=1389203 RepID=A0A9Q3KYN2_9BASI|nr:hypothetical protein [Austropuccinia psidii MF-1]
MSYTEKEALKQLPEASIWLKFSGTGEYDHMELINYIDGLFTDVPSIPDYWITARLNTYFKGNASIWYTEMKEIHGRRNWPWGRSQIIQNYINDTWILQKTLSFGSDRYTVDKDPYDWCLRQSKRLIAIDPYITTEMRNQKLLTKLPGDLEHAVKGRCSKESTLDEISNTLQEVRIRISIGRYNNHSTCDNRENPTLEAKATHDSESEITTVNHPITMQKILPKTEKRYLQERKKQEKTKKVVNLTLIVWGMAVEIIHTVNQTPMRNIWWNLRTIEQRKSVQSTPKGGNQ